MCFRMRVCLGHCVPEFLDFIQNNSKTCVLNILLMLPRVVSTIVTSPVNLGTFCVTCVVRNCTRLRHRNRQPRRQRTTVLRVYVAISEKL